jgi:16S rRNA processing protein RimM
MTSYYKSGKLVTVHGLKGELVFKHELGQKPALKFFQTLFIEEKKGSFIPYFVSSAKKKTDDELLIQIEGIATREQALKLVPKQVWFTEEDFKKIADKSAPANLLGYTIIDNKTTLGEIIELIEQPQQILCKIIMQEKEVYIPIHEESLKKIDHKKKQVLVELPEGLLDIYLS